MVVVEGNIGSVNEGESYTKSCNCSQSLIGTIDWVGAIISTASFGIVYIRVEMNVCISPSGCSALRVNTQTAND